MRASIPRPLPTAQAAIADHMCSYTSMEDSRCRHLRVQLQPLVDALRDELRTRRTRLLIAVSRSQEIGRCVSPSNADSAGCRFDCARSLEESRTSRAQDLRIQPVISEEARWEGFVQP